MSRGTGRLMISLTSPLMRIMLIFLGDITYTPLEYQTPKHVPPPVSIAPDPHFLPCQHPPPPCRSTAPSVPRSTSMLSRGSIRGSRKRI